MTRTAGQHDFRDDAPVLVSPRYLAGGTAPEIISFALRLLKHGFAWHTDPERSSVASPDGQCTLTFAPHREDDLWWRLVHHEPYWSADLTRSTPAEAVAGLTTYLPHLPNGRRPADLTGDPDDLPDIALTASAHSWQATATGWTSPDGHCSVTHDAKSGWRFTTSVNGATDDAHWTASFSRDTPELLVAGFLAELASDLPARRSFRHVPRASLRTATITAYDSTVGARTYLDHARARTVPPTGPARTPRHPR